MTVRTQYERRKIVLRLSKSRLEEVCSKVVAQLALHILLNKSRLCQGVATSGEVEQALKRLEDVLGIVSHLELQVEQNQNTVNYYFLKSHADIVAMLWHRYEQTIRDYEQLAASKPTAHRPAVSVETYTPAPEEKRVAGPDELRYIPPTEYLKELQKVV